VTAYREAATRKSDLDRTDLAKTKTGVFTGSYAINPVNGEPIPIWIADYVLTGYGTGAIMAVPGHDDRDFAFANTFSLPVRSVVMPPDAWLASHARGELRDLPGAFLKNPGAFTEAFCDEGEAVNSANREISLNGQPTREAKRLITRWLAEQGLGRERVNTKLRDWLFSRQRYWGEPFPIVLDADDRARAVPESELPVLLPELDDFRPSGRPEPPLGKAVDWVRYSEQAVRETNTMPQWAGSCWYFLRYLDPKNEEQPWSPEKERYWMPVDLYVGGAEHAVLHLLYSRFWHKVLFDRGHVSTMEPVQKLVNQGMILGETEYNAYRDPEGRWVSSADVVEADGEGVGFVREGTNPQVRVELIRIAEDQATKKGDAFVLAAEPEIRIEARAYKMSKARGNVINPDDVVSEFGADSLRLYEMFMGPLEAVKPWSTRSVDGVYRFLARAWRLIVDEEAEAVQLHPAVKDVEPTLEQARITARTTAAVTDDLERMSFNTAISRLMEFTRDFTAMETRPKRCMETLALLLAPLAPHAAEELWQVLGHVESLAYAPWPSYDPALLRDEEIEVPVQVNGKLRARITVPAEADAESLEAAARNDARVASLIGDRSVKKVIVVPGKLINFVVPGA
jgi:leucyl-tRNA synthetase